MITSRIPGAHRHAPRKTQQMADKIAKKKSKQRPNKKVDTAQALALKAGKPLTYEQIAKIQDCSPQAVHKDIKDLLPTEDTKIYRSNRADILSNMQLKLLQNVDADRLKKASAYQLVGAAGLLYDKERLERGEATQISGYDPKVITQGIADLRAMVNKANDFNVIEAKE